MIEALRLTRPDDFIITAAEINDREAALAAEISQDQRYQQAGSLVLVTVLQGAAPFVDSLASKISGLDIVRDSIRAKSYEAMHSSGMVNILKDLDTDIRGRHVLLGEDIVDTARTMYRLVHRLLLRQPASLEIVTLLEKPDAHLSELPIPVPMRVGFKIASKFVVGYGLDYEDKYRDLPDIVIAESRNGIIVPRSASVAEPVRAVTA